MRRIFCQTDFHTEVGKFLCYQGLRFGLVFEVVRISFLYYFVMIPIRFFVRIYFRASSYCA